MAQVIPMMGGRDFAAVGDSTAEYDIHAQSPLVGGQYQHDQQPQGQPATGGDQYAEYSPYPPPHHQAPQAAGGGPYGTQPPQFAAAPPTHGFQNINDDSNRQDGIDEKPRSKSAEIIIDQERLERPMKLFVGQVPKTMAEEDLAFVFEPHGRILDLTIIRDRRSGSHRGCAFVTYESGEDAMKVVDEMHGKYTFEGASWPAQVRPAQGEIDDDSRSDDVSKLFVGQLPRDVDEQFVRELFAPYGEISSVFVIKKKSETKNGCAFVKFADRDMAQAAIDSLDGEIRMEGVDKPLKVKFADPNKQQQWQQRGGGTPTRAPVHPNHNDMYMNQRGMMGGGYYMTHPPGSMSPVYPQAVSPEEYSQTDSTPPAAIMTPGMQPPPLMGMPPGAYQHGHESPVPPYHQAMPHPYHQGYVSYGHGPPSPYGPGQQRQRSPSFGRDARGPPPMAPRRPREGPAGANLFIYHLPIDLTDADLATAFNPFGNVISAKVYVDRYTGESKGFGFVSYDSVMSAELAIEQMNGFQIGNKRLKVQHKRVSHRPPQTGLANPEANMPLMAHPLAQPAHNYYSQQHGGQMPGGPGPYDQNVSSSQPPQQINVSGLIRDVGALEADDNGSDPQVANES
uniref:RRM domain-containing protein n=1 Tax=Skeletonema marinoi TaxID=267567 RepID=A0A7S2M0M6_9STRA|mmetsp:Transcript_33314/g.56457  ORF Transcript_33314/g.56457 Transcript_33314/m.56457 type:complete len:621 (+) Transcript_33314:298-2160(+)